MTLRCIIVRILPILTTSAFTLAAQSVQQKEITQIGSPCELKGVHKIFIESTLDELQRSTVVEELRRSLPELKVVTKRADSDVHIRFQIEKRLNPNGKVQMSPNWLVVKLGNQNQVRQLVCVKDRRIRYDTEHTPSIVFVRYFIEQYQQANKDVCVQ
jgi:hypothetical protein